MILQASMNFEWLMKWKIKGITLKEENKKHNYLKINFTYMEF